MAVSRHACRGVGIAAVVVSCIMGSRHSYISSVTKEPH